MNSVQYVTSYTYPCPYAAMWGQQSAELITSWSSRASVSPIWSSHVRDITTSSKMSSAELADIRSRNLVPGFISEEFEKSVRQCRSDVSRDMSRLKSFIPILLIQRPGSQDPVQKRIGKVFLWIWFIILYSIGPVTTNTGACSGALVEALCYKPKGHRINSRWCHWNFSLT
jgi:hypothetical protein